jgi:GR25 family glycosyltransferase involved in LPS biosynthesis
VEIGYSASSHANPLIQLTDLAAFTLKKYYELETSAAVHWPKAARDFFELCKNTIWPRVMFKNPSFTKLNVLSSLLDHAKAVRKP